MGDAAVTPMSDHVAEFWRLQARNQRTNLKAPDGRLWVEIAVENGILVDTFRKRISGFGWSPEHAAKTPARRKAA